MGELPSRLVVLESLSSSASDLVCARGVADQSLAGGTTVEIGGGDGPIVVTSDGVGVE